MCGCSEGDPFAAPAVISTTRVHRALDGLRQRAARIPGMTRVLSMLVVVGAVSVGCGPTVDLKQALTITDVATGWHDVGVVDGKNKIVPAINFKVRNGSDQELASLYVNVVFRRKDETDEWGSSYVRVVGSEGLAPGATSEVIRARSEKGYTGEEARADMLKHRLFIDAKAEISAKYASVQLTRIADFPITRQLDVR